MNFVEISELLRTPSDCVCLKLTLKLHVVMSHFTEGLKFLTKTAAYVQELFFFLIRQKVINHMCEVHHSTKHTN